MQGLCPYGWIMICLSPNGHYQQAVENRVSGEKSGMLRRIN